VGAKVPVGESSGEEWEEVVQIAKAVRVSLPFGVLQKRRTLLGGDPIEVWCNLGAI